MHEEQAGLPATIPAATGLPADPRTAAERLFEAWLSGRSEQTRRAYAGDLQCFATFLGLPDGLAAVRTFLALSAGAANERALSWRSAMVAAELSPATINRRLAALRSMVKLGRVLGMVTWAVEIGNVTAQSYRDTAGPGLAGFKKLLETLAERQDAKGTRDRALLRLLYNLGLRRAEACRLNLADVDLDGAAVLVIGKGKREHVRLDLPAAVCAAVRQWVDVRRGLGECAGSTPLFVRLTRGGKAGGRLTGDGVWQIVTALGTRAGVKVRPHGLRHASISRLLDLTNGNVREVQKFSRHASVETVLKYDDNRKNVAGDLARRLAEDG